MKTHRITNVDNSLNVLCNCLCGTAQSKIIQIAQNQVSREIVYQLLDGVTEQQRTEWVALLRPFLRQ